MPFATTRDGVNLWFDEHGQGEPIVFVHEFGGEPASWARQVAHFSDRYRCITYAARGFHPSDTPDDAALYGQHQATADLGALLDHLGIDRAHLAGTSMGSFTSLDFTLEHPERVQSLTLVGNSSGPRDAEEQARYRSAWVGEEIRLREQSGCQGAVSVLEDDPAYQSLQKNLPLDWQDYADRLAKQSVEGALNILKTLHWHRRSLWTDEARLRAIACPVLLVHGEEDYFLVGETNLYLERILINARRECFDATGHLVNIEQAARFNTLF
ncbi:MAG: alpha/beta hydrolase, partial [Pseudomonadota bacterium]